MDLHDFGGVIWAIFIAIAVISSIVRSARRAVQRPAARAPSVVIPSAASGVEGPRVIPSVTRSPAPRTVRTQPSRAPAPPALVIPRPSTSLGINSASGSERSRGTGDRFRAASIFERGSPLARGIVALEILGPPRSMRDWTPLA